MEKYDIVAYSSMLKSSQELISDTSDKEHLEDL